MNLSLNVINSLQLYINQCGHRVLGSKWKLTNVAVPYSKLYYIKSGNGFLLVNGEYIPPGAGLCVPDPIGNHSILRLYLPGEDLFSYLRQSHRFRRPAGTGPGNLPSAFFRRDLRRPSGLLGRGAVYRPDPAEIPADGNSPCIFDDLSPGRLFPPPVFRYRAPCPYPYPRKARANLTAARIAELLYISESTLRKAFLAETGKNLGQYVDEAVLLKAAQLLVSESMSVHDISARLGFCDQFYFSRRFKQRYCMTPTQYRKHNQYLIRQNSETA